MSNIKLGEVEARFAKLIWDNEPLSSGRLAKLAAAELDWKKTTSYTILKMLCERGLFQNEGGTVTSLISREEYYALHSQQYVEETFGGSLPAFLAAFSSVQKLSNQELDELKKLIDSMKE